MKQANIKWENNTPISKSFNEGYFSSSGGLEESSHVFINGNNLPQAWKNSDVFTIAESGFGTGLNFLNVWDLYEKSKNKPKDLYFISVEKEPLGLNDLKKANSFYPSLSKYAKKLQNLYPPLNQGVHYLEFGQVKLILCFGDIKQMFSNMNFRANVWFLDGFSPAKNPDMWDIKTLSIVKNLSLESSTLSTFSVAKNLRDNLISLGYEVEKKEGFGKKRHMLFAMLKQNSIVTKKPWFYPPKSSNKKNAIILGAGIAGSCLAYKLAKRGWKIDILDKFEKAGQGASGNHCGVVAPLITKPNVDLGRMYESSYLQALKFYGEILEDEGGFFGVKHYAYDKNYQQRWSIWNQMQNSIFSCKKDEIGNYFEIFNGGFVQPYKICQKLINLSENISFHGLHEVKNYIHEDNKYKVITQNKKEFKASVLIIALGVDSAKFLPNHTLCTQNIRGQVTFLPKSIDTKVPLCANGYICPFIEGKQLIGATYIKDDSCLSVRQKDHEVNLNSIKEFLPKIDINPKELDGRVSFRCSSSDRFPIIGAVYDEEFYKQEYKALPWKKHNPHIFKKGVYLPNLFISTAHGSRGLTSAVLGANIITSMLENLPIPIENDIFYALHPARFTIRRLQRQEVW